MVLGQVGEGGDREADRRRRARSASACEETSIAQARSPASSMRAEGRAGGRSPPGVVRSTSSSTPPTIRLTVPEQPASGSPPASSTWRSRKAVVVLPLVPVIAGDAQLGGGVAVEARRERGHRRAGVGDDAPAATPRSSGRSTTSAAAPRSTARRREVVAVARAAPGTQKKSVPGPTAAAVVGEVGDLDAGVPGRSRRPRRRRSARRASSRRFYGAVVDGRAASPGRSRRYGQRELGDLAEGRRGDLAAVVARPAARRRRPRPAAPGRRRARSRRTRRRTAVSE